MAFRLRHHAASWGIIPTMNGLPLHPAIVHFPLAFALLVPLLGIAILISTRDRDALTL